MLETLLTKKKRRFEQKKKEFVIITQCCSAPANTSIRRFRFFLKKKTILSRLFYAFDSGKFRSVFESQL
jgi:hypothetical protein